MKILLASFLLFSLQMPSAKAIVNGLKVERNSLIAQSTVSLFNQNTQSFCTGTIIDEHWILTAAHCLTKDWKTLTGQAKADEVYIIFGEFNSINGEFGYLFTKSNFVIIHPKFGAAVKVKTSERNDIALVRFDSSLPKKFKPIEILSENDFHGMTPGTEVIMAGYGKTSPHDHSTKKKLYSFATTFQSTDDKFLVARLVPYEGKPGGNCPGDSGGPAFLNVQGKLYVWGVASTAEVSCVKFGEYGNITAYLDWVKVTKSLNPSKK